MSTWHIAGSGAIGSLAAVNLLANGHKVTPIGRVGSTARQRQFITLDQQVINLPKAMPLEQCHQIDNLFVPLKAYNILPFLTAIQLALSQSANVVLCHNGMGTIEPASAQLPAHVNLYFCTTSNGVFKRGTQVVHAGAGDSFWKAVRTGNNNALTDNDFQALFPANTESDNLLTILWQKLLVNCVINPLTALNQVNNGALAQPKYKVQISNIIAEVCTVAHAVDMPLSPADMEKLVYRVITTTAANTSSMRQDIMNNVATEIDFINGYIVQQAQSLGIAVPENINLQQAIKTLSKQYLKA